MDVGMSEIDRKPKRTGVGYLIELEDEREDLEYQLHAARYAFHAVVKHKYIDKFAMVPLDEHPKARAEAAEMYRKAMENYDGIIANAVSGASHDANQAEMDKGFDG